MYWYRRAGASVLLAVVGFLFALATMSGQTRLDLRSQTKNVDFSGALSTRPFPIGAVLPTTCRLGETWFKPDAPVGQNLFFCAATNIWTGIQSDNDSAPYRMVRSLGAGPHLNVICTSGIEATTGQCTLALDTSNLTEPDGNNVLSGITSFPATAVQNLSAESAIVCDATRVAVAAANPITLTSTATIVDPVRDGQVCIIQNVGSSAITLTNGSSENLKLSDATVAISAGQSFTLIWDAITSLWTQQVSAAAAAGGGPTVLCKGGAATTYTNTSEAAAGVAPNVQCTVPANTFVTGSVIRCRAFIEQVANTGGHTQAVSLKVLLNSTTLNTFIDDNVNNGSAAYEFAIDSLAGGTQALHGISHRVLTGTANNISAGAIASIDTTSAFTLELRPRFSSGAGDDTFSVKSYACVLQ